MVRGVRYETPLPRSLGRCARDRRRHPRLRLRAAQPEKKTNPLGWKQEGSRQSLLPADRDDREMLGADRKAIPQGGPSFAYMQFPAPDSGSKPWPLVLAKGNT